MTSAERRLAKIEAALDPTALVLRWIAEAHAHDDLSVYIGALLDTDPSAFPMDRLAREAKAGALRRNRGRPPAEADQAVRAAIIETIFRVQLALRINVLAQEFVEREVLVQAALGAYFSLAATSMPAQPVTGPRSGWSAAATFSCAGSPSCSAWRLPGVRSRRASWTVPRSSFLPDSERGRSSAPRARGWPSWRRA